MSTTNKRKQELFETANVIAQAEGYKDIHDAVDSLNYEMNNAEDIAYTTAAEGTSDSQIAKAAEVIYERAATKAGQLVNSLLLKCFYQEIESSPVFEFMSFINEFDDIKLSAGNSKEFIFDMLTGISSYDESAYIPTARVQEKLQSQVLSMYQRADDGSVNLSPNAYQFKKRLSITTPL